MNNFTVDLVTRLHFGKGQLSNLKSEVKALGTNVLLVYGKSAIKKNGLYEEVIQQLDGFNVVELPNIDPNPRLESVIAGQQLCKTYAIDVVLAVGGGSVIDCSKAIAAASCYDKNPWDLVLNPKLIKKALPVVACLTNAATGSEMNGSSVISNLKSQEKLGFNSHLMKPTVSICDPSWSMSLSAYQTAAGAADIMSHVFENYFSQVTDSMVSDLLSIGILETVMTYCPIALENPTDYEARANLMWASTMGLNGLTGVGKGGAWSCHPIEHELSAFYDITHGTGLAIITPHWMRHILSETTVARFVLLGKKLFSLKGSNMEIAKKTNDRIEAFLRSLPIEKSLEECHIDDSLFDTMAQRVLMHKDLSKAFVELSHSDIVNILEKSLQWN
ncbi:MAG: iron-containing alcohol dehydrogenase [Erysipelothrix sp.]|nr:iron-containing alcohol dehydrogenase [Erysipelothrix sp.]